MFCTAELNRRGETAPRQARAKPYLLRAVQSAALAIPELKLSLLSLLCQWSQGGTRAEHAIRLPALLFKLCNHFRVLMILGGDLNINVRCLCSRAWAGRRAEHSSWRTALITKRFVRSTRREDPLASSLAISSICMTGASLLGQGVVQPLSSSYGSDCVLPHHAETNSQLQLLV